jgi:intracellular septation protein A
MSAMPRIPLRTVIRVAIDFGLPLAAYYGLRMAGAGVYVSLIAGSLLSATSAAVSLVRDRRLDGLAAYMTVMMLGSVGVSFLFGGTRFLLAKGALLTGVTGVWFIASAWSSRPPLAYLFSRPLLEGRFHWPDRWDELWERLPRWRRMWRISSVLFGIGSLLDAAFRVWMAYTLSPDKVPALSTALYIATSVVLIVINSVYYIVSGVYFPRSALYGGTASSATDCAPQPTEAPDGAATGASHSM